jgi:hypothetical protein
MNGPTGMSIDQLRGLVRERIAKGDIPAAVAGEVLFGGYGNGSHSCVVCGRNITGADVEFEVHHPARRDNALYFHIDCHAAWHRELAAPKA